MAQVQRGGNARLAENRLRQLAASSSRRGMKRRSRFSGSRKRKLRLPHVPASNCAQSDPNALADRQSSPALRAPSPIRWARESTRECSSPSSIRSAWRRLVRSAADLLGSSLVGRESSGALTSGRHREFPFIEPHLQPVHPQRLRQRPPTALSLLLWLRKTSYSKAGSFTALF